MTLFIVAASLNNTGQHNTGLPSDLNAIKSAWNSLGSREAWVPINLVFS